MYMYPTTVYKLGWKGKRIYLMLNWQDHGSKSLSVRKVGKVSMLIPSNNWIYVNRKGFSCSIWRCFNFCSADKIYKKKLYSKVMAKKRLNSSKNVQITFYGGL